jgi:excisionase family DNA binding protein
MPASKMSIERPFLTAQEVSDLLRVSVYTVRRWIKVGALPAYKVGRGWRIKDADLDQWLDGQRLDDLDGDQGSTR